MIVLKKLNVVKKVASEDEATKLESLGYKRLEDYEEIKEVESEEVESETTTAEPEEVESETAAAEEETTETKETGKKKGGATTRGRKSKSTTSKVAEKEDK